MVLGAADNGGGGFRRGTLYDILQLGRTRGFRGVRPYRAGAYLLEYLQQGHLAREDMAYRVRTCVANPHNPRYHGIDLYVYGCIPVRGGAVQTEVFRSVARTDGVRCYLLYAVLHSLDTRKRGQKQVACFRNRAIAYS